MQTAVVYKSYLGTTKKYVHWLAEALKADVFKFDDIDDGVISRYKNLIITSGTYAGKMPLTNFLKNHWSALQKKHVYALAVGIAPVDDKQSIVSYQSIPLNIRKKIKYFKVPGSMFGIKTAGEPGKDKLNPLLKEIKKES